MINQIRNILRALIPTRLSTRLAYRLSHWKGIPKRDWIAEKLIALYNVKMDEAIESDHTNRDAYPTLNSLFTRHLKPGVRPLSEDGTISSPVDGTVSQIGRIENGRIIQAKNHDYSLEELLAGSATRSQPFMNGHFATIYLSPRDYHRVHMPVSGKLTEQVHIPGRLLSVSPGYINTSPSLFARNERVAFMFETDNGPAGVIMVGAVHVGSIETVWSGQITPPYKHSISEIQYENGAQLSRGDEMGHFNMGSTVILLFPEQGYAWNADITPGLHVQMGQEIGKISPN